MLPPYRPVATAVPAVNAQLIGGACIVGGWSFVETSGSASASFELYDGSSNGGNLITSVTLASNESTRDLIGGHGIMVRNGVWIQVLTGTAKGAVWVIPVEIADQFALTLGYGPVWSSVL